MAWSPKFTFSVTWDNITGKPLNYPTTWSLVGEKPSTFPSTWATVSGKPETATRWPTWNEVTGKPTIPQGTVTSVSAGAGMSFSTITGSGAIALGSPSQVNTTSTSTVTGESHSHSFSSLFSDSTSFTADNPPEEYPSSVVSLSRVGSLADTGWPTNGVAANFMAYGNRYGQLYFSSNSNQVWFRTGAASWRSFEELWHSGNFDPATKADDNAVVKTSGNQSDLSGTKTWTGTHIFEGPGLRYQKDGNADIWFRDADETNRGILFSNASDRSMRIRSYAADGSTYTELIASYDGPLTWNGYTVWHEGNDGAGSGLDADYLRGMYPVIGDSPNSIARRDTQGDITARLLRSTFPSQSDISSSASVAYRINDSNQSYVRFCDSPSALRGWLGLGSAATSNISDFASSSRFTYIGSVSGGSYYDYFPGGNAVSYFFHAAGNSPSDAPASPAKQTAVLGMDTSWGTTQLAITNENSPQVFVRANGVTSWNRVWTAGDFDPSSKFDNPSGSTSQYIRGNGSLATFPSIPTSSDYVATSGNQTGLSGNKTWSGSHYFNAATVYVAGGDYGWMLDSRDGGIIGGLSGIGSTTVSLHGASVGPIHISPNGRNATPRSTFNLDGSVVLGGHTTVNGTISDSIGNVRKPEYRTANGTITLSSNDVNRIVEKSNNSSYTYTIPSGHGSHGDIITFVNSGTSGNLTINRASGVSLYRNGTNANITVGPGSTVTIYRSATSNRWIA